MLTRDDLRITIIAAPGVDTSIVKNDLVTSAARVKAERGSTVDEQKEPPQKAKTPQTEGPVAKGTSIQSSDDFRFTVQEVNTAGLSARGADDSNDTQLLSSLTEGHPHSPIVFVIDPAKDVELGGAQYTHFQNLARLCNDHSIQREWVFVLASTPDGTQESACNSFTSLAYLNLKNTTSLAQSEGSAGLMTVDRHPVSLGASLLVSIEDRVSRREYQALEDAVNKNVIQVLRDELDRLEAEYSRAELSVGNVGDRFQALQGTIDQIEVVVRGQRVYSDQKPPIDLQAVVGSLEKIFEDESEKFDKRKDQLGVKIMRGLLNALMVLTVGLAPAAKKAGHAIHRWATSRKQATPAKSFEEEGVEFPKETGALSIHTGAASSLETVKLETEEEKTEAPAKKVRHRDTAFFSLKGKTAAAGSEALENAKKLSKSHLAKRK